MTAPHFIAHQNIWLDERLNTGPGSYHIGGYVELRGPLEIDIFGAALKAVAVAHAGLHMQPVPEGDGFRLLVCQDTFSSPVSVDLSQEENPVAAANAWMAADFRRIFPAGAPLFRWGLIRLAADRHFWTKTYHHLIVDGHAISRIVQDAAHAYTSLLAGRDPGLAGSDPLAIGDPLAGDGVSARRHWSTVLAAAPPVLNPVPPLPPPHFGPPDFGPPDLAPPEPGMPGRRTRIGLERRVYDGLTRLAAEAGAGLPQLLLVLASAALLRRAGRDALVAGLPVANRPTAAHKAAVGLFATMQPAIVAIDATDRPLDVAAALARRMRSAYRHRSIAFAEQAAMLAAVRGRGTPAFDLTLSFEPHDYDARFGPATATAHTLSTGREPHPLSIFVRDYHDGAAVTVDLDWRSDVFAADDIPALIARFDRLCHRLLDQPEASLGRLDRPDAGTLARLGRLGRGRPPRPGDLAPLTDAIAAQAAATPAALAVVDAATGDRVDYQGLVARAGRRAAALQRAGAGPETVIGLAHPSGIEAVVSRLAVSMAGAAWLPLDPEDPPARRAAMRDQARPLLVLDDQSARALDLTVAADARPAARPVHPEQLAYLLFTSGSTGTPKPVAVPHRALAMHMAWMGRRYPLGPDDVVLQKTPAGFDASIWEFLAPLMAGARLVLAPAGSHRNPEMIGRLCADHSATILQATPTLIDALAASGALARAGRLRRLFAGGEILGPATIAAARAALPADAALINLYGPTECCIDASAADIPADLQGAAPLGDPVDGASLKVIDAAGDPVGPGVAGELAIGGLAVGRGYHGDPVRTALAFRPDPEAEMPGARRYLTGDRVRRTERDALLALGRIDGQIKLGGRRIEPGEIEAALMAHPAIAQAGAALLPATDDAAPRLGACIVLRPGHPAPAPDELRRHLAARLPAVLHPAVITTADRLPLSRSGKLDRRALGQAMAGEAPATAARARLDGPLQAEIAAIWAEVLDLPMPGSGADFFALGGHSLKAMQVATRLRAVFDVEIGLEELFDHPRLDDLAALVAARRRDAPAAPDPVLDILPVPAGSLRPLSFAQERIWFLAQWPDGAVAYNMAMAVRIDGPLDVTAFAEAAAVLPDRHPMLRTCFAAPDGVPLQRVDPEARLMLATRDLRDLDPAARDAAGTEAAARDAATPFDLTRAPLLRLTLLRLADDAHVLLVNLHHIAGDGWSGQIVLEELTALYAARIGAGPDLPPAPALTYADVADWQRRRLNEAEARRQLDHWRGVLTDPPVLDLPTDRPRPPVVSSDGGCLVRDLPADLPDDLRRLAAAAGGTPFMVMTALFGLLLGRMAGQDEVVIGTPVTNRPDRRLEDLVGFFTNTLPLRLDLKGGDLPALLSRTRATCLAAFDHPDLPFERLVDAFAPERSLAHTPLFQVMLAWQLAGASRLELPGLAVSRLAPAFTAAKFDLMLSVEDSGRSMSWRFDYRAELFEPRTIALIADRLTALIRAAARHPAARLPELFEAPVPTVPAPPAPASDVVDVILARLDADPGRIALVDAATGISLSAAELAARARRRAAGLVAAGIGPDRIVALAHPRGAELVVSMLAVAIAGGAWLALDEDEPEARRALILATAAPDLVLDADGAAWIDAAAGDHPLPAGARHPDRLAYLLFTSGSTGTPKPVAVPHRALARHMAWMNRSFPLDAADAVLQKTPTGFDASVWEFQAPLMTGARLVLAPSGSHRAPETLGRLLDAHGITILQATPTLVDALAATDALARGRRLRRLFIGGEALGTPTIRAARAALPAGCAVINLYGPTECCIDATAWVADDLPQDLPQTGTAPLGAAIDGVHLMVLDRTGRPVPPGLPGELAIGGETVGRGYHGDPVRTALAFRPDPAAPCPGARCYLTGDRVLVDARGRLRYQGRIDAQMKLRGQRIEPGEIEAVLSAHPAIARAGVTVISAEGGETLVAWLTCHPGQTLPAADVLRRHVARHLPIHMIPARFIATDSLPLTASGKLDRRALAARPLPAADRPAGGDAPASPVEILIADIWAEVLDRPAIARSDDFFALGGHSLKAVRMLARLNEALPVEVPLRTVFENPTVATLAAALDALTDAALAGDDDLAALLAEIEALPETDGPETDGPGTDGPEAETFPDTAAQ
ncbi:amino acid adenylation domain-containing protein [Tistrella mobilis]|uniref:amino acid adenylation domain-containing protein n=1 Tax=Tistrella mobilis TaxID=171437 RepID=UPI003558CF24